MTLKPRPILIAIIFGAITSACASTNYPTPVYITLTVTNASPYDLVGPTNLTRPILVSAWDLVTNGDATVTGIQAQITSNDTDIATLQTGKLAVATNTPSSGQTLTSDGTNQYWSAAGSGDWLANGTVPATGDFDMDGHAVSGADGLFVGTNAATSLSGAYYTPYITVRGSGPGVLIDDSSASPSSALGIGFRKAGKVFSLEYNLAGADPYFGLWYYTGAAWVELWRIDATDDYSFDMRAHEIIGIPSSVFSAAWNASSNAVNEDVVYDALVAQSNNLVTAYATADTTLSNNLVNALADDTYPAGGTLLGTLAATDIIWLPPFLRTVTLANFKAQLSDGSAVVDVMLKYYTNAWDSASIINPAISLSTTAATDNTWTQSTISNGWQIGLAATNVTSATNLWWSTEVTE